MSSPFDNDPFAVPAWSGQHTPAPQAAPQPAPQVPAIPAGAHAVRSVSVSWLASEKVDGHLISYTAAETVEFEAPVSGEMATSMRANLLERLKVEGAEVVAAEAAAYRASRPTLAAAPSPGHAFTSAHPVAQQYVPAVPQTPVVGTHAAAVQGVAAGAPVGGGWATGYNPKGTEVRYITSTAMPTDVFRAHIEQAWAALGFSPAVVGCYDNRIGARGLEAGQRNYSPGAVRLLEEAPGYAMLAAKKKTTVGYASFNAATGAVEVKVTPDYQQAVELLRSLGHDPFATAPAAGQNPQVF